LGNLDSFLEGVGLVDDPSDEVECHGGFGEEELHEVEIYLTSISLIETNGELIWFHSSELTNSTHNVEGGVEERVILVVVGSNGEIGYVVEDWEVKIPSMNESIVLVN
jgi:hypothetical protein